MLSDDEIDKLYEIDDYIEAAEKANVLYIERYDIWQMDRVTLKAFAKLVEERTAAKERADEREACAQIGDSFHDDKANCGDLIRARGNNE